MGRDYNWTDEDARDNSNSPRIRTVPSLPATYTNSRRPIIRTAPSPTEAYGYSGHPIIRTVPSPTESYTYPYRPVIRTAPSPPPTNTHPRRPIIRTVPSPTESYTGRQRPFVQTTPSPPAASYVHHHRPTIRQAPSPPPTYAYPPYTPSHHHPQPHQGNSGPSVWCPSHDHATSWSGSPTSFPHDGCPSQTSDASYSGISSQYLNPPSAGISDQQPTKLPIQIRTEEPHIQKIVSEPAHLAAINSMVSLALDILEHEDSFMTLVYIGRNCVKSWGRRTTAKDIIYPTQPCNDEKYCYQMPGVDEMTGWVYVFLGKVRHCFPPVLVKNVNGKVSISARAAGNKLYGSFQLGNWWAKAHDRCTLQGKVPSNENVMLHWEPADAGIMTLDLESIQCLARVKSWYLEAEERDPRRRRDAANYRAFLLDGGLTIAHELVHCFVGFLSGNFSAGTPTSLAPTGFGTKENGESGRTWEFRLLGGCASLSVDKPKSDHDIPRARLWLEDRKINKETEICPEAVKAIVKRNFEFPPKNTGWVTRRVNRTQGTKVFGLFNWKGRKIGGPSPFTSHPSVSPVETKVVQGSGGRANPALTTQRHSGAIPHRPLETASRTAGVVRRTGTGPAARTPSPNVRPKPTRPRVEIPQSQGSRITQMKVATSAKVNPAAPAARGARPSPAIAPDPSKRQFPRQERTSGTAALARDAGATGGRTRASISRDIRDQ